MNARATIPPVAFATTSTADLNAIGAPLGGGYLTAIMIAADGRKFALITAPKDAEFEGKWHPDYKDIPGLDDFDCITNTAIMAAEGSPIAQQVRDYRGGGFDDWGIPGPYQSDAQYRTFKPTTAENYAWLSSANPHLFPIGYRHTETSPAQTTFPEFQEGGDQAFEDAWYWQALQYSSYYAHVQYFGDGYQHDIDKGDKYRVRPVRMIQLID